jgi:hypothetical protein
VSCGGRNKGEATVGLGMQDERRWGGADKWHKAFLI